MPNITALKKLDQYIQSHSLKPMKKWSSRSRFDSDDCQIKYMKKLRKQFRNIMILVSGNDIVEMLKDMLKKSEREELSLNKYKDALINLSEYYQKMPQKQRHNMIRPLKNAGFNRNEARRLGFRVSEILWDTCDDSSDRNIGGGRSIPDYLKDAINNHLANNSINKTSTNGVVKTTSSSDHVDIMSLYKSFPFKNQLAKSTFFKYAKRSDKHGQKELCDHCEKICNLNENIDKEELTPTKTINQDYLQPIALVKDFELKMEELNEQISNTQILELKLEKQNIYVKYEKILKNFKNNNDNVCYHIKFSRLQRDAYNNHYRNVDNVLKDKLMIKIDHKQNIFIELNHKRSGINHNNDQKILSCLGFIIKYVDSNNCVQVIHFDIITSELKQHSKAAINGFKLLRKQDFFKQIDKQDYIVWCSKYIMSQNFIGYLLGELADEKIHVNLNFFYDKRSKSGHFLTINQFIEDELLVNKLDSSQDVVEAIFKQQKLSNESKLQNRKPATIYAIAVDLEEDNINSSHINAQYIEIKNFKYLYNLQTIGEKFDIVTSVVTLLNSDLSIEVDIISKGLMPENLIQSSQKKTRKRFPKKDNNNNNTTTSNSAIKIRRVGAPLDENNRNLENFLTENFAEELITNENQNGNFTFNNSANNINYMNCDNYIQFSCPINSNKIPKYCRITETAKKPQCVNCHAICNHTIESILDPVNPIGQSYIYAELSAHGHPKCRVINNRQRKTREAARELADHYIYAHGHKEPFFV